MKIDRFKGVSPQQMKSLEEQDQKLRNAAELYEKHFLRELVKAMRSTVPESEMQKPSMGEKIFRDNLDSEYVEKWGEQGGIGFGQVIYEQLKDKFMPGYVAPRAKGPVPLEKGALPVPQTEDQESFKGKALDKKG